LPGFSVSRANIFYDVLNERKPVSPKFAVLLGKLFGDGAGVWTRMQGAYDTWHAERDVDVIDIPILKTKAA
jgi:plasmid maintenance system antidote protein VapI